MTASTVHSHHVPCFKAKLPHRIEASLHHAFKTTLGFALFTAISIMLMACGDKTSPHSAIIRHGQYCYRGETLNGQYHGYGVLYHGDSVVYEGQWQQGKRQGRGMATDIHGRRIQGQWQADTLVAGICIDTTGTYTGEMDTQLLASGHGVFRGTDGSHYDGYWQQGKRQHFGCGITATGKIQTGEWNEDKYRGERMTYTTERIYGIDISRYQHGKGKKKYPIHWNKLRITHLGNISKKRVQGKVDYPMSFVYIKSTEGTTVVNPYYASDYLQAHRHHIPCGAYHFFSTTSDGIRQARHFIKHTRFAKGDFPPVLDVEPSPSQIRKMGGAEVMFRHIRAWLTLVEKHAGVRPILYISQQFVNKYLPYAPDIMRDYKVWIARYGAYKPEVHLVFWQLSPDGRVNGITGEVDINVFNGYGDMMNELERCQ